MFKLSQNTDTVDIDQKCLGVSPIYSGPETNNRGLHIQIRHNGDKATYEKAIEIQKLITAAPDLYEAIREALFFLQNVDPSSREYQSAKEYRIRLTKDALKRARGEK